MYGNGCKPICCPPQYCVRDYYSYRAVPVIHPIVTINRQNIVAVPQHLYQPITRNVVVEQGFAGAGAAGAGVAGQGFLGQDFLGQGNQGYTNRLFF